LDIAILRAARCRISRHGSSTQAHHNAVSATTQVSDTTGSAAPDDHDNLVSVLGLIYSEIHKPIGALFAQVRIARSRIDRNRRE